MSVGHVGSLLLMVVVSISFWKLGRFCVNTWTLELRPLQSFGWGATAGVCFLISGGILLGIVLMLMYYTQPILWLR